MNRSILLAIVVALGLQSWAVAAPKVVNGSFEADRYTKAPGQARANGGKIQGWQFTGSVGLNPTWEGAGKKATAVHTFDDNGRVPDGRQVALLQNEIGRASCRERV